MKLTLVLELVNTLLTTSMSVSCSSSIEQSDEELGSLSVRVDVLEWLCSGSPPAIAPPDNPMLPPPDPEEHPLPSRWLSNRIPPPPLSSELPAERAASPAAARWRWKYGLMTQEIQIRKITLMFILRFRSPWVLQILVLYSVLSLHKI